MRTMLTTLLLATLSTAALAAEPTRELDRQIASFEKRTGIDVHVVGDRTEPRNAGKDLKRSLADVDPDLAAKMLPEVEKILMMYTEDVRGPMLKDLYLVGALKMGGKPFLGAAYPKTASFDLAVRPGTSERTVRRTMHHEIAHLIENAKFFPVETWKAFAQNAYVGRTPSKKWKAGKAGTEEVRRAGFVSKYASKNRHEDFAELAEVAFTKPATARKLSQRYPLIGDKLRLMTDVYRKAAPGMKLPWTTGIQLASVPGKRTTKG